MKTKFIYLHGFNSDIDPNSEKVKLLKSLGDVEQLSYDTFDSYKNIIENFYGRIDENEDPVFVGTSLGGYYAAALASHFCRPAILINPAIDPYECFKDMVGTKHINYINGEERILEQSTVDSYKDKKINIKGGFYNKFVLLDSGDELLDAHKSKKYFEKHQAIVLMFEGGNHRFEHMKEALHLIEGYVNICEIVSDY